MYGLTLYNIQTNNLKLIGQSQKVQIDNDLKHNAKATQAILHGQKWDNLQRPNQSLSKPNRAAFRVTDERDKTESLRIILIFLTPS